MVHIEIEVCSHQLLLPGPSFEVFLNQKFSDSKLFKPENTEISTNEPIVDSLVERITDRDGTGGRIPHYLNALIERKDLFTGMATSQNARLAERIRSRGRENEDDCGHIVANVLGGKMVDFNLFPQDRDINRGWNGFYLYWREIERFMFLWLIVPGLKNPKVDFKFLLNYNDNRLPHRPSSCNMLIIFQADEPDDSKNEDFNELKWPKLQSELHNLFKSINFEKLDINKTNWNYYTEHVQNLAGSRKAAESFILSLKPDSPSTKKLSCELF